jgi:hypothetical protein
MILATKIASLLNNGHFFLLILHFNKNMHKLLAQTGLKLRRIEEAKHSLNCLYKIVVILDHA